MPAAGRPAGHDEHAAEVRRVDTLAGVGAGRVVERHFAGGPRRGAVEPDQSEPLEVVKVLGAELVPVAELSRPAGDRRSVVAHERVQRDRHLSWSGCFNARDLGGLHTVNGQITRWAAVVRSDALDDGWSAAWDHGIRTIIDLRNDDELGDDVAPRPTGITTIHLPLDANDDREFWDVWDSGQQFGTPLYYRPHLERFPDRTAEVLTAIATAPPGGVAFHCGGGRDRAGQIAMVLLALLGVPASDIAADYMLSYERLPARYAARGEPDQGPLLEAFLTDTGTTAGQLIIDLINSLDLEAQMRTGGLTDAALSTLRDRLLTLDNAGS